MSHISSIDIEIKSLDDLATAAKSLGLELKRGQTTYKWYGRTPQACDHAIVVPDQAAYEIGIKKRGDGKPGFVLEWDDFNPVMRNKVGQHGNLLKQAYARAAAIRTAQQQGFRVNEARQADGTIRLQLTRG